MVKGFCDAIEYVLEPLESHKQWTRDLESVVDRNSSLTTIHLGR
jgi:hypothetical protein